MEHAEKQNPDGTWSPAIPEPYWVRHWFRWRPSCYTCLVRFRERDKWEAHWIYHHGPSADVQARMVRQHG